MDVLRVSFVSGAVLDLTATIATALVAVTLGSGSSTVRSDSGLTILLLTPELYAPLRALAAQFHASADGLAAADRIIDLIDGTSPPIARGGADPPPAWRSIRLEGCASTTPIAPRRCSTGSISRSDGEIVALTGASGAGKSTVASLLLGLRSPDAGAVMIGEHDLASLDVVAWRRRWRGCRSIRRCSGEASERTSRCPIEEHPRRAVRAPPPKGSSRTCRADRTP